MAFRVGNRFAPGTFKKGPQVRRRTSHWDELNDNSGKARPLEISPFELRSVELRLDFRRSLVSGQTGLPSPRIEKSSGEERGSFPEQRLVIEPRSNSVESKVRLIITRAVATTFFNPQPMSLLWDKLITQGEKRKTPTNKSWLHDKLRVCVSRISPPQISFSYVKFDVTFDLSLTVSYLELSLKVSAAWLNLQSSYIHAS